LQDDLQRLQNDQRFARQQARAFSRSPEDRFGRRAHGFKPAADIYLGVSFATEMTGSWAHSSSQIPLDNRELLISALDHIPMDRILTDNPANLALKFLQTRHGFSDGEDSL
jgi:hypothetical protein